MLALTWLSALVIDDNKNTKLTSASIMLKNETYIVSNKMFNGFNRKIAVQLCVSFNFQWL